MTDLATLPGLTDRQREIARETDRHLKVCHPGCSSLRCSDPTLAEVLRDLSAAAVDRVTLADADSKVIALLEKERDRERARAEAAEREWDAAVGLLQGVRTLLKVQLADDDIHEACENLKNGIEAFLTNPATAARTRRIAALQSLVMLCDHELLPHMEQNDKFDGRGSWSSLTNKLRTALATVRKSEEPTK